MAILDFSTISVPIPSVPYDPAHPTQNLEMLSYCLLQVFQQLGLVSFKVGDKDDLGSALVQAVADLQYVSPSVEMGAVEMTRYGILKEHG